MDVIRLLRRLFTLKPFNADLRLIDEVVGLPFKTQDDNTGFIILRFSCDGSVS